MPILGWLRCAGRCRGALALVVALAAPLLAGCSALGYYGQAVRGHLELMEAARPVRQWLQDPDAPAALKQRLQLAERLRAYAVAELHLPDNASYTRYAALKRKAAVWNVAAAPADSLQLERWCFLMVGCVSYRGYYNEGAARAFARHLRAKEHLETTVYGVPAYSTLGWLNWLGGDPLLSTFIRLPDGALARLLFHELAHQAVYVSGDTAFNESFATAVGRLGARQWLRSQADAAVRRQDAAFEGRRLDFRQLVRHTRAALQAIYAQPHAAAPWERLLQAEKEVAMVQFRARYRALKARWAAEGAAFDGFDAWVATANNASFALQATYDGWVPSFEALFQREGGDWRRFLAAVKALAQQPRAQRDAELRALAHSLPPGSSRAPMPARTGSGAS